MYPLTTELRAEIKRRHDAGENAKTIAAALAIPNWRTVTGVIGRGFPRPRRDTAAVNARVDTMIRAGANNAAIRRELHTGLTRIHQRRAAIGIPSPGANCANHATATPGAPVQAPPAPGSAEHQLGTPTALHGSPVHPLASPSPASVLRERAAAYRKAADCLDNAAAALESLAALNQ